MSPSGSIRGMASGGARPKQRNLRFGYSFLDEEEEELERISYDSRSEHHKTAEIRGLRATLCQMDKKLSRALGLPPGLSGDHQDDIEEELLLIRRFVIELDQRLSSLLVSRRHRRRDSSPPADYLILSQSVQQCLKGLSKLSQDVDRLRLLFHDRMEDDSTLYEDEDTVRRTAAPPSNHHLNNNTTSQIASRPNNYWDNVRSFSRTNPLADGGPQRRGKSKINRENNVDPCRVGSRWNESGSMRKKRIQTRLPTRVRVPDVNNLTESPLSTKHFTKVRSLPEPSDDDDDLGGEEIKSVFDVVLLSQDSNRDRSSRGDSSGANIEEVATSVSEASGGNASRHLESLNNSSSVNNNQEVDCLIETAKMNDLSLEDERSIKMENSFFLSDDDDDNYQTQDSDC